MTYFYGDEDSSNQWEQRDTRARLGLHNDQGTGAPDPISIEALVDEYQTVDWAATQDRWWEDV